MEKKVLPESKSVHINIDEGWVSCIWLSMEGLDKLEELLKDYRDNKNITSAVEACQLLIKEAHL